MKKLVCLILCLGVVLSFASCGRLGENLSDEYRILELTENKIPDEHDFAVTDKNGKEILTNSDVEKVLVVAPAKEIQYMSIK